MQVECGGVVSVIKKIMTKQGNKPMAIITVEDIYGEFDCMMFPKTYEKFAETLAEDRIAHINGKISIRVGEKPIILIESIDFLDEAEVAEKKEEEKKFAQPVQTQPVIEKPKTVYLQFNIRDRALVATLQEIFLGYPGKSPVKVQFDRKLYPMNVTVEATNSLKAEVSSVIGEDNIKII
jgi:DNA polymerase III alpha subunit